MKRRYEIQSHTGKYHHEYFVAILVTFEMKNGIANNVSTSTQSLMDSHIEGIICHARSTWINFSIYVQQLSQSTHRSKRSQWWRLMHGFFLSPITIEGHAIASYEASDFDTKWLTSTFTWNSSGKDNTGFYALDHIVHFRWTTITAILSLELSDDNIVSKV